MKKILITGLIIILLAVGVIYAPLQTLDMYDTGFGWSDINNGETLHIQTAQNLVGELGAWYGNTAEDYTELILEPSNNNPVVTVWRDTSGADSVPITIYGVCSYAGPVGPYWEAKYGWYRVFIKTSPLQTSWKKIIDTENNMVDDEYISYVTGKTTKQLYATEHGWSYASWLLPIVGVFNTNIHKKLDPIVFSLKGSHVGVMKVEQVTEFWGAPGHSETGVTSRDWTFLISGKGDVSIVDEKTRYIAGEDTIKFRVNTKYSGKTQGGEWANDGWELTVFDNKGSIRKTWKIADDTWNNRYDINGQLLDYQIPSDAVSSGASHTWSVVLTNTLFEQDDEAFFAITKEELAKAPGIKPITFGENQYNLGDTVEIIFEGIPNPSGTNRVDGFLVNILYGQDGTDYIQDFHLKYVSATNNKRTITFQAAKGDTYITVEAWAFDAPETTGGVMSEKETGQVWVKDKEHEPIPLDYSVLLIAVGIIFVFGILALILYFIPGPIRIVIFIIGIFVAVVYYMLNTGML